MRNSFFGGERVKGGGFALTRAVRSIGPRRYVGRYVGTSLLSKACVRVRVSGVEKDSKWGQGGKKRCRKPSFPCSPYFELNRSRDKASTTWEP